MLEQHGLRSDFGVGSDYWARGAGRSGFWDFSRCDASGWVGVRWGCWDSPSFLHIGEASVAFGTLGYVGVGLGYVGNVGISPPLYMLGRLWLRSERWDMLGRVGMHCDALRCWGISFSDTLGDAALAGVRWECWGCFPVFMRWGGLAGVWDVGALRLPLRRDGLEYVRNVGMR